MVLQVRQRVKDLYEIGRLRQLKLFISFSSRRQLTLVCWRVVMNKALRFALFAIVLCTASRPLPAQVVVSQVYGGGGNSGAIFKNDFIELFNSGSSAVVLTGWSVQYVSASGSNWQVTPISGTLQPGQYYLVQEAVGAGGTTNLPVADTTDNIAMSATAGKIALVNSTTALSGACPTGTGSSAVNFVGYGSGTNCSLGTVAPAPSNTTADIRKGAGCVNAGNNSTDFSTGAPAPRNSSSALNPCSQGGGITVTPTALGAATVSVPYQVTFVGSGGTGPYTFSVASGALPSGLTLNASGLLSGLPTETPGTYTFGLQVADSTSASVTVSYSLVLNGTGSCTPTATIAQVQGPGNTSLLNGSTVTVQGVVTGLTGSGFFLQMAGGGDGNVTTSDGVYVFTSASGLPTTAQPGNALCVTGTVNEYAPSSDPNSPTDTEIGSPTSIVLISTGNTLPQPIILTASDTDPSGTIDQLEKYEGMRVQVSSLTAVAPTDGSVNEANATASSNGLFYGVITGIARPFREPGVQLPDPLPSGSPCCVVRWDSNPEILGVDSSRLAQRLNVTSGITVTGLVGPLEYTNRAYFIVAEAGSTPTASANSSYTAVPVPVDSELTIAAYNLEHFYNATGADPGTSHAVLTATAYANRLNKASLAIRNVLRTPDILAVEEAQNLATLQDLATKINADASTAGQPNPDYQAYLSLGNDISGINSGFLVKSTKVTVNSVTQYGKSATYTTPTGAQATLNDRPPLVLNAVARRKGSDSGLPVIVVVNHLRSLLDLDTNPTVRAKREAQAEYAANLIQSFQQANPGANVVSVGDYNAYQFSDGFVDTVGAIQGNPAPADQVIVASPRLVSPMLTNLIETSLLSTAEKYSYSFDGSAQAIDHILVSQSMLSRATRMAFGRVDADFPETYRADPTRPERVSDHDPIEAYFTLPLEVTSKAAVTGTGFIYSRVTKTYQGSFTIANNSTIDLAGPVYLKLNNLPSGVSVTNAGANGLFTVSNTALAAGQTATVTVQLANPANTAITYTSALYSSNY